MSLNASLPDNWLPFARNTALEDAAQPLAESLCKWGKYEHSYQNLPMDGYRWYPGTGPRLVEWTKTTRDTPAQVDSQNAND